MPIPIPDLDDRTFTDLVAEGRALIPRLAPEWTNHNPSDPGITLVELFAYLSELLIYRLNRVTDDNVRAFLRLLNGPDWTPRAGGAGALARDVRETIVALRRRERAVTGEDYEALALEDARVLRARAVPRRNLAVDLDREVPASISVVVLPRPVGLRLARIDLAPLAGRVHTAGVRSTALIGVGTSFRAEAQVGDTLDFGEAGVRVVADVSTDDRLTLDAAVTIPGPPGVTVRRVDQAPLSGTVHTGGETTTRLIGVGTAFARELNAGQFVVFGVANVARVTDVGSDTALTLEAPVTIGGPAGEDNLTDAVRDYLEPRRLLTAVVNVVGPQYTPVRVEATVVAAPKVQTLDAKRQAVAALMRFLDPVAGGVDGTGWPFGRDVFVSELYEVLERLDVIDHVTRLTCSSRDASRLIRAAGGELVGIALRSYELPSPQITEHDVAVESE